MNVIRMEDKLGVGMYHSDCGSNPVINGGMSDDRRWPMPQRDTKLMEDRGAKTERLYPGQMPGSYELLDLYKFCFCTYEQMEAWIYDFDWRVTLGELGIIMSVYEVDDDWVMIGATQCTFRRDKAKLLGEFCPTTLKEALPL